MANSQQLNKVLNVQVNDLPQRRDLAMLNKELKAISLQRNDVSEIQ